MKQIITLIICLCGVSTSYSQLDSCERLFYQFNPKYISLKTTELVLDDLVNVCEDNTYKSKGVRQNKGLSLVNLKGFVPGLGGHSQRHSIGNASSGQNNNGTAVASEAEPRDSTSIGFVANNVEQNADEEAIEEQINNEEQDSPNQNIEEQQQQEAINSIRKPAQLNKCRFGNYRYSYYCQALLNEFSAPVNSNTNYMTRDGNQVALDNQLVTRLLYTGKDYHKCYTSGGQKGDCFNKAVLTKLSNSNSLDTLNQLLRKIGNSVSNEKAQELEEKALQIDPNLYTKTKTSLNSGEAKGIDSLFATEINNLELSRDSSLLEIYEVLDSLSQDLLSGVQELEQIQDSLRNNLVSLENINAGLEDFRGELDTTMLMKSVSLTGRAQQSYYSSSSILRGSVSSSSNSQLQKNCLEGKLPCPPEIANTMGQLGSQTRAFFEANANLNIKFDEMGEFAKDISLLKESYNDDFDLASKIGISGSAQEKVAIGMHYAEGSLNTVIGFASAYKGDPNGLIQGIQGLSSLIGGPFKSQPSPEFQAIMQLREEMHERFDVIEQGINQVLETQVEIGKTLARNIQINREVMQYEFNDIDYQLSDLRNRQNLILAGIRGLLGEEYNGCNVLNENFNDQETSLSALSDFADGDTREDLFNDCLTGLSTIGNAISNESYLFFTLDSQIDDANQNLINSENENYKQIAKFFRWFYQNNLNLISAATKSLLFPSTKVSDNHKTLCALLDNDYLTNYLIEDIDLVLDNDTYISVPTAKQFIENYNRYAVYYDLRKDNGDIRTSSEIVEFSVNNLSAKQNNHIEYKGTVNRLNNLNTIALAQQSLMSGTYLLQPFYSILYNHQYDGEIISINDVDFPVKQVIVNILSNNPVLAQNFAVFVLRKNFLLNAHLYKNPDDWKVGEARNPGYKALLTHGYQGLPTYTFLPNDSIFIHSDSLTTVSADSLDKYQFLPDLVDFGKWKSTEYEVATINIDLSNSDDCTNSTFITCSTQIPFPSSSTVLLDQFTFTNGYEQMLETTAIIEDLKEGLRFGDEIEEDWQSLVNVKTLLLNNVNVE